MTQICKWGHQREVEPVAGRAARRPDRVSDLDLRARFVLKPVAEASANQARFFVSGPRRLCLSLTVYDPIIQKEVNRE
jgi:hypothetical protein